MTLLSLTMSDTTPTIKIDIPYVAAIIKLQIKYFLPFFPFLVKVLKSCTSLVSCSLSSISSGSNAYPRDLKSLYFLESVLVLDDCCFDLGDLSIGIGNWSFI